MKKETIVQIISGLIAALFFYASFSKLLDYEKSLWEMKNQIFPPGMAGLLTWLIPLIEILLMSTLLFSKTRKKALWGSLALLTIFTSYIAIITTGIFSRTPCSCGGILKNLSYGTHLIFNLFFIAIALIALAIENNWKIINRWFYIKKRKELA